MTFFTILAALTMQNAVDVTPVARQVTQVAARQNAPAPRSDRAALIGTWELVGERCCGDPIRRPWTPIAANKRKRVTFSSNGRFVSSDANNPQGQFTVDDGIIEGWEIYTVAFDVTGNFMVVYHVPTREIYAFQQRWQKIR